MEYIVALDTYRHFVRAAESCGVSQSTLSTLLKKLEDELDIIIFDRDAHPLKPTPAGEKVIAQSRVILFNVNQLREMTLSERLRSSGEVSIALIPTVAPYIVPKLFKQLNIDSPDIHPRIFELQTSEILAKLSKAELDMAIMATPLEVQSLLEVPLYYEKLVMYVSPDEPLYKLKEVHSSEIPSDHLWMLKEGHCLRNQV
ncbi:MAG: LysR substrate-binding domain-containing protein, partial [Bacteroidia bacterium]|nr:LysR substrate-binding domain-containing protein [Bacteroidia bacterium]